MSNYPRSRQEEIDLLIKKSKATLARSSRQDKIDRSVKEWRVKPKKNRRVGEYR